MNADAAYALEALETGLAAPAEQRALSPALGAVQVAALWLAEVQLRPGNTASVRPGDLVVVLERWAAARGLSGPHSRAIGRALEQAGLHRKLMGAGRERMLLLAWQDAHRLRRMVREAAPEAHRERLVRDRRRKRVPRRPPIPVPAGLFHEELTAAGRRAGAGHAPQPLVDSAGRVYPTAGHAARYLGGRSAHPRAISNAAVHLRALARAGAAELEQALKKRGKLCSWRGLLWRRLSPAEVAAIPSTVRVGEQVGYLGWGLCCRKCGVESTPEW